MRAELCPDCKDGAAARRERAELTAMTHGLDQQWAREQADIEAEMRRIREERELAERQRVEEDEADALLFAEHGGGEEGEEKKDKGKGKAKIEGEWRDVKKEAAGARKMKKAHVAPKLSMVKEEQEGEEGSEEEEEEEEEEAGEDKGTQTSPGYDNVQVWLDQE